MRPKRQRPGSSLLQLEPRIMYDAAAAGTAAAAATSQTHADASAVAQSSAAAQADAAAGSHATANPPQGTDTSHATAAPDTSAKTTDTHAVTALPAAVDSGLGTPAPSAMQTGRHEIVFIDGGVADAQLLAAGVKPGDEVFVLDPTKDGVTQIADILAAHNEHNVDAIHIVSHGTDATLQLGNNVLTTSNLDYYSTQLGEIGAALKPGGDLLLYGCDVAHDVRGLVFIAELGDRMGGVHVAASVNDTGASALGGDWTLEAHTGSITATTPFTDATLSAYSDILTSQIWYVTNIGGASVQRINSDGTGLTTITTISDTGLQVGPWDVALDTAHGKVYYSSATANTTDHGLLISANLDGTGVTTLADTGDGNATTFSGTAGDNGINGIALDLTNGVIYFETFLTVQRINVDGSNRTTIVSNSAATSFNGGFIGLTDIAIDPTNNKGYIVDDAFQGGVPQGNAIYSFNLDGTGTNAGLATVKTFVSTNGAAEGLDIDTTGGTGGHAKLYVYATADLATTSNFVYTIDTGNSNALTTLYSGTSISPSLTTSPQFNNLLEIDKSTNQIYVSTAPNDNAIRVGNLDGSSSPFSLVKQFGTTTAGPGAGGLVINDSPTVTASSHTVNYEVGASATVVDSAATTTDPNGINLANATVSIGTGFVSGDTLAATTTGTSITASYVSGTGVLTLSGVDTFAHYQQVLQSITFSTSSGTTGNRTINFVSNDGSLASNTGTDTVSVLSGPAISGAGNTVSYQDASPVSSPVTVASSISVTDPANTNLSSATFDISGSFLTGDTLAVTTTGSITVASNTGGVLKLTGSDTLAHYNQVLESLTYSSTVSNARNDGANTSRTGTWTVSDGVATATATSTVNILNATPTVTAGATVSYQDASPVSSAVAADSTLTVADIDSANFTSATVSIGTGFLSGDALNFTNQNGITGNYVAATGILTLTGTTTKANYQTALESITFSSSSSNARNDGSNTSRTINWTVVDDASAASTTATSTVNILDAAPTVAAGNTVNYPVQGSAVTVDSALTVADIDSANFSSATVSVGTGFASGDTLNFTNQNGITGSYVAATGILTLTGTATKANYQTALESITFSSTSSNSSTRTINWKVADDASAASNTAATTLNVAAPTLSAAGNTVSYQDASPVSAAVSIDSALAVSDSSSFTTLASATVDFSGSFLSGDTIGVTTAGTGVTVASNTGGVLRLTGTDTLANYQAVLRSVSYSSTVSNARSDGADTSRAVTWTINDGTATATATSTVNILDAAPTVAAGNTVNYPVQGSAVTVDSALTVADIDSANFSSATASVGTGFASGDTLNFTNQNGITGSYVAATGILTLTGTATKANYQTALESITFSSTSSNSSTRTINWKVADDASAASNTAATTLNVAAPTLSAAGNTVSYQDASPVSAAVSIDSALAVSDSSSFTTLASATVDFSGSFLSGDTIGVTTAGTGVTVASNTGGVLRLTGTDTLANYQAVLRSVSYSSTVSNARSDGADTSRAVTWTINDGTATATATSTVNILDAAPTVTAGASVNYTTGDAGIALDSTLTVADIDSANFSSATVSVGTGFASGDTLNFTNQNGITGSYVAATGILTLTGTATKANYQTALESITFSSTSNDTTSRTINWKVVDDASAVSNTDTSSISVTASGSPTVTAGANASYTERNTGVALDSTLTVADPASSTLASATISIGTGFLSGDTLNFTNQNGITGSYDSASGVLTLTGAASLASYQTALQSITFSSPSHDPTNIVSGGGTDTSRTISWVVNDGTKTSSAVTSTVTVTPINEAPTVSAGAVVAFTPGGTAVTLDSDLAVADVDNANLATATVSIGTGFAAGDALHYSDQNGISGSYNSTTGVLTLSGGATKAAYQTALRSITFDTTAQSTARRTVNWTVNDGNLSSTTATSAVSQNQAPPPLPEPPAPKPFTPAPPPEFQPPSQPVITLPPPPEVVNFNPVIQPIGDPANINLFVDHGLSNLILPTGARVNYTLPQDTFASTNPGTPIVYSARQANGDQLPTWLTFDPATRTFNGAPPANFNGNVLVRVDARDPDGHTASTIFAIQVGERADINLYVAHDLSQLILPTGARVQYTVPRDTFASTSGVSSLIYSAKLASGDGLPSWLTFDSATRTFNGNPPSGYVGRLLVRVEARDADGHTVSTIFPIEVGGNQPGTQSMLFERDGGGRQTADWARREIAALDHTGFRDHGMSERISHHVRTLLAGSTMGHSLTRLAGKPGLTDQLRAAGHGIAARGNHEAAASHGQPAAS